MKKKNSIIAFLLLSAFFAFVCIYSFVQYDKPRYYIGRSLFDYKEFPLNIRPGYISLFHTNGKSVKEIYEFYFINDAVDDLGNGSCCVYDQDDYKLPYDKRTKYSIEHILEYYYDKNNLFILCQEETGKQIWVKPFDNNGDIIFLRIPYLERSRVKNLKRVVVPESMKGFNDELLREIYG